MDTKYIIGIIVVLLVIVGAYFALAGGSSQQSISIVGSTSVQPVAEKLATEYMKKNPDVKITVQGGGSGVGIPRASISARDIGKNPSAGAAAFPVRFDMLIRPPSCSIPTR